MEQNAMEWYTDAANRESENEVAEQSKDKDGRVPFSERYVEYLFAKRHIAEAGGCSREILSFGSGDEPIDVEFSSDMSYAIDANYHKGCNDLTKGRRTVVNGSERVTVGTLRTHKDGEGFREMQSNVAPTLNARARQGGSGQCVIQVNPSKESGGKQPYQQNRVYETEGVAPALNARLSSGSVAIPVLTPERPTKRQNGRRMKSDGEASFTVTAQDRHGVMIATNNERAGSRVYDADGIVATVTANVTGGTKNERYQVENKIRRLTPTECARLQGFEDDWADFGMFQNKNGEWHVREISDTGKYQVFGNAVTTKVITATVSRMIEKGCLK